MSKGAIPVKYIVAIIFAIVVIAIILFMFFTHTGIFSDVVNKEICEANKLSFCFEWQRSGYNGKPEWDARCTGIGIPAPATEEECEEII